MDSAGSGCCWPDALQRRLKLERDFNFTSSGGGGVVIGGDDDELGFSKTKKTSRDPMSHRIIEKRRRDRMNNCLADLSRLIPSSYLKKARGRIEKTEIIEMAIRHLKYLQAHQQHKKLENNNKCCDAKRGGATSTSTTSGGGGSDEQFYYGYQECLSETMHFLVEVEGFYAGDTLCVRLLGHLQQHSDKISRGFNFNKGLSDANDVGPMSDERPTKDDPTNANQPEDDDDCHMVELDDEEEDDDDDESNNSYGGGGGGTDKNRPPYNDDEDDLQFERLGEALLLSENNLHEMMNHRKSKDDYGNERDDDPCWPRSGSTSSSGSSSVRTEEVYKFKNNIKERFHADLQQSLQHSSDSDGTGGARHQPKPPPLIRLDQATTVPEAAVDNHRYKHNQRGPKAGAGNQTPVPPAPGLAPADADQLPLFVLHPKGTFYVPMTIDAGAVTPHLSHCWRDYASVLHPVSIAVSFGHTAGSGRTVVSGNSSLPVLRPWTITPKSDQSLPQTVVAVAT